MQNIIENTRAEGSQDRPQNTARRHFMVSSAAAGGGLVLGMHLPFGIAPAAAQGAAANEINLWVVVRPDETCVIRIARAEMGQGTLTGL
ncbi:MAG: xanthine dehydrogenase family protein molybdopterin-binding subunit, partial [Burkholderiales bacterium]|nr:xanthine dehydrogenase family protein molybdopterin-binding subunit [Burkholderiales bacterium]